MIINNLDRSEDAITTIRAVEPGDRDQWERLYRQYAEFYRVSMDDAIQESTWSWLMAPERYPLVMCDPLVFLHGFRPQNAS